MKDLKKTNQISRRHFLKYSAVLSASLAGPVFFQGCAVDPVTGKNQIMMVSQQQEIGIDRQQSPFQFSADYGITQDKHINQYVSGVGKGLLPYVHRPGMPYNFQCVNAVYINAYAFPGGSIAVTRGILLKLENEAELASLLGHELGHVNARHTAEQVSKGQLSSLLVGGLSMAASSQSSGLGQLTQQIGMLGQSMLLSKYSRDNEREADYLGNEYMVKAGYPSRGFVGLMEVLDSLHQQKPSSVEVLFSTHPMSDERLADARQRNYNQYKDTEKYPLNRERYMDNIASLRKQRQSIELIQEGEKYFAQKEYDKAESAFKRSIESSKNDYAAHVLLSKCLMVRKKTDEALLYAQKAKQIYPSEVQGHYTSGMASLELKKFGNAYMDFNKCDILLPGNPQIKFFKGYCLDKNGDRDPAAKDYMAYLKMIDYQPNQYSKYAFNRLQEWGYAN